MSPIWEESRAERIEIKICTGLELYGIITEVKFEFEKFQGF